MQDAYVGDIGDFAKYGLLRALRGETRLGVAWYLHPSQPRAQSDGDGRFTQYLLDAPTWSVLDPELFEVLGGLVGSGNRSVSSIEASGLLGDAVYAGEPLDLREIPPRRRESWRQQWFRRVEDLLAECEIIFADPDNGLCPDERFKPTRRESAKHVPLAEVAELVGSRPAIIYHHNTRFRGGHLKEIQGWMERLPNCDWAWYWRRWSNRTFFILNADRRTKDRLQRFADQWKPHGDLVTRRSPSHAHRGQQRQADAVPRFGAATRSVLPEHPRTPQHRGITESERWLAIRRDLKAKLTAYRVGRGSLAALTHELERAVRYVTNDPNATLGRATDRMRDFVDGCPAAEHTGLAGWEWPALYEAVRRGRNDLMHSGTAAALAGTRTATLTVILMEVLLNKDGDEVTARRLMVTNPVCAHGWQTLADVRRTMLLNDYSALPLRWKSGGSKTWRVVTAERLGRYLLKGLNSLGQNPRLGETVENTRCVTQRVKTVRPSAPIVEAKCFPVLVVDEDGALQGIVTDFDLL